MTGVGAHHRARRSRSTLIAVAVMLTLAAPTQPGWADAGGARCAVRGGTLPAHHRLAVNDTGNSLSRRYYGSRAGARWILASIGLNRWPPRRQIVASRRYRVGDTIVIPKLPTASIEPRRVFRASPSRT